MGPGSPPASRASAGTTIFHQNEKPTCGCGKRSRAPLPCFRPVIYREWCNSNVSRRQRASDHFLGLVVGLAVAAQRRRLGAGVEFREPRRDPGLLALEQAVAGKVALHQERPELVDVE